MFVCEKGGRKRGISGSSSIPSYPLALNWCGEGTLHRSPVELCRFSFVFEKALEAVKVSLYIFTRAVWCVPVWSALVSSRAIPPEAVTLPSGFREWLAPALLFVCLCAGRTWYF